MSSQIFHQVQNNHLLWKNDRAAEFYTSFFQNFLKAKNLQHYSRFTDKSPSISERLILTVRNLLGKPIFKKENADWWSELPSIIEHYNVTIQ